MRFFLLLIVALVSVNLSHAQPATDSANMPIYLKTRIVPGFKLLKMDSTYFYKYQLKKKTPIIIVYFGPTCGHCQKEAKAMVDSATYLKKAQVVFISSSDFDQIKNFAAEYKLNYLPNSIVGRDEQYYVTKYYRVSTIPFVAVYDRKGELINAFEGGTSVANLSKLIK